MSWKKTTCVLCGNRCGLEVEVENNRIVKSRGDKDCPVSQGYICRKGMNIAYHQHNADRVLYPLKRMGDKFGRISWDQAVSEISARLREVLQQHGPRSLASLAGGGEFYFSSLSFFVRFASMLGTNYQYSSANQEFSGRYWAHGLTMGSQALELVPDIEHSDMFMAVGWNGMKSNHYPRAANVLQKVAKDPDRLLVAIDPRPSDTARIADIHLALRPSTDALLLKSMIAIIIQEKLYNREYIDAHVDGFNEILPWFAGFDVKAALKVCELEYDTVVKVCRDFATRRSSLRDDLGILMGRHSALNSYLLVVLLAICGRIGVQGGNYLVGGKTYSDPNDPKTWRTQSTNIPAINGMFPPNVMPEEILSGRADRLRAVIIHAANPLRSYADTTMYEKAFRQLDLLVVSEIAMSETAQLAHYVLPSRTVYESWDITPQGNFTDAYGRAQGPVLEPEGEQKECGEIYTLLADAMGFIPPVPDLLYQAANSGDPKQYRDALIGYVMENPDNSPFLQFIVSKTLGKALGSAHLSSHFAAFLQRSKTSQEEAVRAGFAAGPDQGLEIYQATLDHPEGILIGIRDPNKNLGRLATPNGRFRLYNQEVVDWIREIDPVVEEKKLQPDDRFPLVLMAGRHIEVNSNTAMRDPAWNKGRRACTLAMNPVDAERMKLSDGRIVRVVTEAGEETIELEVTEDARKGQVIIPHGFGLVYDGVKYGANVNRLTKNTHRDFVGTPMHRYVPCRVEAA
jgi:anaerobic selenocysteine-containing dehydrogenase